MSKPLLVSEVAERLRVSERTVLRMIESGRLPGAFDVSSDGRRKVWRIPESDLEALAKTPEDDPRPRFTR